jgi:hypothetical protein
MATRIRRLRTTNMHVDSRDHADHLNRNPASYTIALHEPLPNVSGLQLLSYHVPYSPTFLVMVQMAAVETLHTQATALRAALLRTPPNVSSTCGSIVTTTGTVDLHVTEVFTIVLDSTNVLDVFVCVGTCRTSDLPLAYLSFNGTSTAFATVTDPVFDVRVVEEPLHLLLDAGQGQSRLVCPRRVFPSWEARMVYYAGEMVTYASKQYMCRQTHFSMDFANDLAGYLWGAVDSPGRAHAPSHNAFHVIESESQTQTTLSKCFTPGSVSMDMSPCTMTRLQVSWVTRSGQPYRFPFRVTQADTLANRMYLPHSLSVAIKYEEDSEVIDRPSVTSIPAGPSFLLPSYQNVVGQTVRRMPARQ